MGLLSSTRTWIGKTLKLTDAGFWSAYYGGDSVTGKSVTAQTALQLSAVWSCVRLLSETVGTLPIGIFEHDARGGKNAARDHSLYRILHDQPHANLTAVEFWELVVAHIALWGNHYSRISRNGAGTIVALEPLNPEHMNDPEPDEDGNLQFIYNGPHGREELTEKDVFHVKGFGVNGRVGMSVIGFARNSFSISIATEEAAGKTFANGMQTAGFVQADKVLTKEQREKFNTALNEFTGSSNAGKTMLLEGGFTYQPLSLKPEDAQMLLSRGFNIEEVCRWFRVFPWMIGHSEKSTSWGTGLEQGNIAFLTYALRPYLSRIEQAIKRQLLTPVERKRYFAEFNLEGLLRADSAGRAALYSSYAQNGINTRNEIRARENLPPVEGGDVLTVQSNLINLESLGQQTGDQAAKAALKAWLLDEEPPRET
ncbi:phage portal protein [Vreelandella glaciei]|uniref:phage portal protein n=1 Tax=Vreelandella glaciei TaxID=186761 RepID=UPI0030EF2349|tara:strand:- start:14333 stop:15607 length:1275 start_codon:yes stop_codon:yes gene_type:complete